MFFVLYQLLFILSIIPYLSFRYLKKKKADFYLKDRLGLGVAKLQGQVIWIHGVSLGETKAAQPIYKQLKKRYPKAQFVFTSSTKTGLQEAKKNLGVETCFLPYDLSFCIRNFLKRINPSIAIFMEGDLWPNLARHLQKNKVPTLLLNAQMSDRSYQRFQTFSFLARKIFSSVDVIFAQSDLHKKRFEQFGAKEVLVSGNIKFANVPELKNPSRKNYGILDKQTVVVLGSTHDGEEELLLRQLQSLDLKELVIFVVPRHPERFAKVESLLKQMNASYCLLSDLQKNKKIILVDQMGKLMDIYVISDLAIVGGSFVQGVGGHNILEPIFAKTAVGFGPYMKAQQELTTVVLDHQAGVQLELETLQKSLKKLILDKTSQKHIVEKGRGMLNSFQNLLEPIVDCIEKKLSS